VARTLDAGAVSCTAVGDPDAKPISALAGLLSVVAVVPVISVDVVAFAAVVAGRPFVVVVVVVAVVVVGVVGVVLVAVVVVVVVVARGASTSVRETWPGTANSTFDNALSLPSCLVNGIGGSVPFPLAGRTAVRSLACATADNESPRQLTV